MKALCSTQTGLAAHPPAVSLMAGRQVRQLSESPAFRVCRRRTGELLADNRRLEFLQALERSAVVLTDGERGCLRGILDRAGNRHYHYAMNAGERALCDGLRHRHADQESWPGEAAGTSQMCSSPAF